MNKIFQLNFLGVENPSDSTLDSLKELFVSTFGLSDDQIETILLSAPVTLIESENKEELLPIYELLKSASAQVAIEVIEEEVEEEDEELAADSEEDEDDDSFDLDEEEVDEEIVAKPEPSKPTVSKILDSSEEISFDFHSGDDDIALAAEPEKPAASQKPEEEITLFSFDDQDDAHEAKPEPEAPKAQIANNASHEDIGLSFESDEDPHLNTVESAKLTSESVTVPTEAPLKSNALKLNFDIKPKDQEYLEKLQKQKAEENTEIKDEEIELKDGVAPKESSIASTGFDNIIHKASYSASSDSPKAKKIFIEKETLQYLIPIVIGCTFVIIGSLLILPQQEAPAPVTTAHMSNNNEASGGDKNTNSAPVNSKYYGKSENQAAIVEGTLTRYSDELRNISLTITPPPPQALTPEDLVLNKKLPPWIEKLTLDQFKLNPSKEDASFLGVSKARIFVNYDQHKYRLIVPVAVRAMLNKETQTARVAVVMKFGIKDAPEDPYLVEISPYGQHKIYLKSVFEVAEVKEENAPAEEAPAS